MHHIQRVEKVGCPVQLLSEPTGTSNIEDKVSGWEDDYHNCRRNFS